MLREAGKRLPSCLEYAQTLLPIEQQRDDIYVNQYGMHSDPNQDILIPVQTAPGRFRFMPGPEFSPRLYRGQNRLFAPCRPSLYRQRAIDAMYWAAKVFDLGVLLWQHPALLESLSWNLEGLSFDLNLEALAQHYGYPTVLLDFSRSKDVAMFFATCAFDPTTGEYRPLESGTAVLYTADLRSLLLDQNGLGTLPLGFEPLPRPSAQMAFAVSLDLMDDLNEMAWITKEDIELTPSLSKRYFDMFEGGRVLFPSNAFDTRIDALRESKSLSINALKMALSFGVLPPHPYDLEGVVREFEAVNYRVIESVEPVSAEILATAAADWSQHRPAFVSRTRLRGVADHMQQ